MESIIEVIERPIDSCKIENGQIVHVEYLTEHTTIITELIPVEE